MSSLITMFDAVPDGVDTIPGNAQAVAGYVDGFYVSFPALLHRFWPHAHCLSIAVHPGEDAACLDVETGDAGIGDVPGWLDRQISRGQWRPCVYASQDWWENQGLLSELERYGGNIRRWLAAYPGDGAQVKAGYDAHQYSDTGGGGAYDVSVCLPSFFPAAVEPAPDPFHYDRFATDEWDSPYGKLRERQIVLSYDGARKHVDIYGRPHRFLRLLRDECEYLRQRVAWEAQHGEGGWGANWRRWRFEQLTQRAHGARVA